MNLKRILLKTRTRIFARVSIIALAVAFPALFATGMVSADTYEYCNYDGNNLNAYCLYAGLYANSGVVTGDPGSADQGVFFSLLSAGGGNTEIVGESGYYTQCIGDYENLSGNASAGMDECPTQGSGGWGTNFTTNYCSNGLGDGYTFRNNHWSGGGNAYLGPNSWAYGVSYFLNKPTSWCFAQGMFE